MLAPGLKKHIFSISAAAQKGAKRAVAKSGSSLDFGPFSVQFTKSDDTDYLDRTIAKQSKITECALGAVSGKTFGNESVLTALMLKKPVTLSAGNINIDQRVLADVSSVEHKNDDLTYKIHDTYHS